MCTLQMYYVFISEQKSGQITGSNAKEIRHLSSVHSHFPRFSPKCNFFKLQKHIFEEEEKSGKAFLLCWVIYFFVLDPLKSGKVTALLDCQKSINKCGQCNYSSASLMLFFILFFFLTAYPIRCTCLRITQVKCDFLCC